MSCDIGCHLFSILPPFNIGNTTMGYGLGGAGAAAFNVRERASAPSRSWATAASGTTGLPRSVGNAVFNKSDNVLIVVDNGYSAATGGQDMLSSAADNAMRSTKNPIEKAVRGVGVNWVRTLTRTYDVAKMRDTLKEALTTAEKGPKVIIAQSECMLNKQRRERPLHAQAHAKAASAWCASASASIPTPAPAIIPASGCRAARRSRSRPIPIRCGASRSPR